jgi:hypothetical protein
MEWTHDIREEESRFYLSQPLSQSSSAKPQLTHYTDMSAINNPSRYVNLSPERIGACLVNGHQWKPANGLGLISRTSIRRPTNDRYDEGPYLSCDQVGILVLRLLSRFSADTGLDRGDRPTPGSRSFGRGKNHYWSGPR